MRTVLLALLLTAPAAAQCPGDVNGDRRVTIAELVQAVNAALDGCDPATPTATAAAPTRTRTQAPTETVSREATLADLIGTWDQGGNYPRWVLHTVVDESPPRLAGYRPGLADAVAVYYATDLPTIPRGHRFVLISRDASGGDSALVFAFSLTGANQIAGVRTRAGILWPASGAAPNWSTATALTLDR